MTEHNSQESLDKQWKVLLQKMEKHHVLFFKMASLGKPVFTNSIPTAAVVFNAEGDCVNFLFNKNFWDECDEYKKLFVISHECLHVILNHGKRFINCEHRDLANIAQDIAINHMIVDCFGFVRENISDWEEYCWVDTVFKNKTFRGLPYPKDRSAEFYYEEISRDSQTKNKNSNSSCSGGNTGDGESEKTVVTVDVHMDDLDEATRKKILEKVTQQMTEEEKEDFLNKIKSDMPAKKSTKAGTEALGLEFLLPVKNDIVVKRKWETVIHRWKNMILSCKEHESEQWIRKPRRLSCFDESIMVPNQELVEDIHLNKDKIDVALFLDTSGSCIHLAERFFNAASTLNPKKFNIRLYCFDTKVYDVDIKERRVFGGGGTSFQILEQKLQEEVKSGSKYPSAIFVITDGYGDKIQPQHPERWHWFLSEIEYSNKLIPKESHKFDLNDFE